MRNLYQNYPATVSLILIQLIVYILLTTSKHLQQIILYYGSAYHEWILKGEVWRILTSIFIQAEFSHLFYNVCTLLLIGTFLESFWASKYIWMTFLLSGILSNLFLLFLKAHTFLHYGSSSATAGIIGATAIHIIKKQIPLPIYAAIVLLIGFGFHLLTSIFNFQINTAGHFIGFISGYTFAFLSICGQKTNR